MNKQRRIIDYFSDYENIELDNDAIQTIENDWISNFCNISKRDKEDIHLEQYKWHTFSYEKYPSLSGKEALDQYYSHKALSYIVLPEFQMYSDEVAFITNTIPDYGRLDITTDFYVFPKNMAWTMAFTHEQDWLGPYFAKNTNYEKLNNKNNQALNAKLQGW
jgi:hypothetical protein